MHNELEFKLMTAIDMATTGYMRGKRSLSAKNHITQVFLHELRSQLKDSGRVLKWV